MPKVNYQNTKIYILRCEGTNKVYIGHTARPLTQRLSTHKTDKNSRCASKQLFSIGKVTIHELENYPCDSKTEAKKREQYFIDLYSPLCVNQQRAFIDPLLRIAELKRNGRAYYERNKELVKEKAKNQYTKEEKAEYDKQYWEKNKEKIRERKRLKYLQKVNEKL